MSFEDRVAALPTAPSYWWKLNDAPGAGTAAETQAGNTGTPQDGTVTFGTADAPPGCSITRVASFASAYLSTANAVSSPSSQFTQGIWLKTTATGAQGIWSFTNNQTTPPSGGRDFYVYQGSDGNLYCGIWNGSYYTLVAPTPINDGHWHFLTVTFDGSTLSLYVDGALVASGAASVESYGGYWRVCGSGAQGGWPNLPAGSDNPFTGEAAHALIWMATALTAPEVAVMVENEYPNWIARAAAY